MQFDRIAAAADEHHLGDTRRVGQFAVAEVQPAAVHGIHLDIPIHPVGTHAFEIAKLDVLAGDVAAHAFTDRAVRRLGGELVQLGLDNLGIAHQQLVELAAIDGHTRILDANAVLLEGLDRIQHDPPVAGKPLLRRQIHLHQFDVEPRCDELFQNALKRDLRHLIAVQNHQRLFDLYLLPHVAYSQW